MSTILLTGAPSRPRIPSTLVGVSGRGEARHLKPRPPSEADVSLVPQKEGHMNTLRLLVKVGLLALMAGPVWGEGRSLGPVSITGDQTLLIHLISRHPPASRAHSLRVAIDFWDANGVIVASAGGGCSGDFCIPDEFMEIGTDRVTSVSLRGDSLGLALGESITVQPVIRADGPALAHLLTTVDVIGFTSPFRFAIQFEVTAARLAGASRSVTVGPLTLQRGEKARFTVAVKTLGAVVDMSFMNADGARIGASRTVQLGAYQSASIELDGDAADIPGVPGVIRALGKFRSSPVGVIDTDTLEILDKSSGSVKAVVSTGASESSGSGGGGGGG